MLKLNRLLAICLFVLLLSPFLTVLVHANPSPVMYVSPASKSVNVGSIFSVGVNVSDVVGMTCWQFTLIFDTSKLQCINATEGPFLRSGGNTYSTKTINNTSGSVLFGCTLTGMNVQVSGSGVLATVTFNANTPGQSTLHLADTLLGDTNLPPKDIPHTTGDGIVYVGGSSNTAPVASNLVITPASPRTTDNLGGSYTYYDADGDSESGSEARWYKNGMVQSAYNDKLTVPASATARGEVWYFTVRPKDGKDFGALQTSSSVAVLNTPPVASNLAISPSLPRTTDNLVGSYDYYDADGDGQSGSQIRWYKNGVIQSAYNDLLTIPSSAISVGQQWYFTVTPKDGTDFGTLQTSPTVTIQPGLNTAPVASNLTIAPSSPKTADNLVGGYAYNDADGNPESGSEIRWYKNGAVQSAYNDKLAIPSSATAKGQVWYFTVRPKDGRDFGDLKTSPSVTVVNSPPVASGLTITPSSPKTTDNLVGSYTYYDADGDAENGSEIRWYKDGVSQSAYNDRLLVPSNTTAYGQVWYFTVKPKDGEAFGSLKQSPSVTVGKVNTAPVASNLKVTPSTPLPSDNLTAKYDYYDVDGDPESGAEISWYKNGVLQPAFNDTFVVPSNATSVGDTWYFTVRPKDGKDFGALQTSPSVTILARHDVAVANVVPSKTVVGQGYPLFVNVTVANSGGFNETFDVAAYASARVIGTTTVTLPGYGVTSVTFTWNTTDSDLGKYTMSAVASAVPGETNVADNTYVYGTITVGIPGDLNCDDKVNIIDLVFAAMSFNCKSGDTKWNPNADVNNDGKVNIIDISLLAKWYWDFQVDQLKPKTGISIQPSSVQKSSGDVGTDFNVTVTIENVTDLFGFDLNVTWDNALITLHTCYYSETLNGLWGEGNWFVARNLNGSGWCQLAALSTKAGFNTTSSRALFVLEFRVENPAASTIRETPIHFESRKLSDSKYTPITHVVQDGVYRAVG